MDKTVIIEKFQSIDNCLKRIHDKVQNDVSNIDDIDVQDIFVLNLQRAIQTCIDVAAHIIKQRSMPIPKTLREYFSLLFDEGILSESLSANMCNMVGFRNIAVHEYEEISVEILKSIYLEHLCDISAFQKEIAGQIS